MSGQDFSQFPKLVTDHVDVANSTYVTLIEGQKLFSILRRYGAEKTNDRSFGITTDFRKRPGMSDKDGQTTRTLLLLGQGLHKLDFKGRPVLAYFHTSAQPVGMSGSNPVYQSITCFVEGKENQKLLQGFMEQLVTWDEEHSGRVFKIYTWNVHHQHWQKTGDRLKRPLDSVVLPKAIKARVVNDMATFLESSTWYSEHGIPYKRNYLFYGPPGSGKTSFIQALVGEFDRNLCFLQPANQNMTDMDLKKAVEQSPARSIIVLEDIDSLFGPFREKLNPDCPLTFSGFLNALDGIGSPDGQIFILTTNHAKRLDPALVRAGRVDIRSKFSHATVKQAERMFLLFYPKEGALAKEFAQQIKGKEIAMATLQNHFIQHKNSDPLIAASTLELEEEIFI